jgi:hypothetical protein
MKKINLILSTLFSLLVSTNFAQWTSVGQPDFTSSGVTDVKMDIKQNGNSVVVYKNTNNDSIYAFEWTNNQWIQLSNSAVNSTFGYQSELALDNNDVPHVIYRNAADSLFIKKWNGSSWENFGSTTGFVGRGSNAKLKFSPNNEPVVAFSNLAIWPWPASVVRWDGNSWGNVLSPSVSNFQAGDIDFEFTTDNQIYIAITNLNGGALSVYKSDVSSWVQVGPSSNIFGGSTFYVELELNSSNVPSVLCAEGSLNNAASMKTWDGNNWVYVGNQGFSVDPIGYTDYKIVNQIPTVIFQNGTSRVMQYQNGSWSTLGSTLGLGNSHALAIRNDNTIFAAYNNLFNGYKLNVKKFCVAETSQATETICQGQSYNFGSQTLNAAGSYSEVFVNSDGCDSLVNLSLTILPTYSLNQAITLCAGESLQIGNSNYSQSGNYQTILTSQSGCDSTINTQLTVLSPLVTSEQQTICEGNYLVYNGDTLTIEADYDYVFQAQNGCDSTHTIQLTIENALNPIITETDGILSSSALGDNFQWIDCNNNLQINGAITNQFTPINDGNYAVEVTNNQCAWMSDCYTFSTVSLTQINEEGAYFVYPNPAVNAISINIPNGKSIISIIIADELGRMVKKFANDEIHSSLNISDLENGFYIIHIDEKGTETTLEFIIRR